MPDSPPTPDHRRAAAERSIEAILDAAESLLAAGSAASTSAVAAAAGVSRVTVYSHFPTREAMLEAVADRVVTRGGAAIAAASLDRGPAPEALDRLIEVAWSQIDRHGTLIATAGDGLSSAALIRAHEALNAPILALIERGRREGAFRTDVPVGWLLSSYYALMHAYGDNARAGRLDALEAVPILQATLRDVFCGGKRRRR